VTQPGRMQFRPLVASGVLRSITGAHIVGGHISLDSDAIKDPVAVQRETDVGRQNRGADASVSLRQSGRGSPPGDRSESGSMSDWHFCATRLRWPSGIPMILRYED